jgi:hypothetical protein
LKPDPGATGQRWYCPGGSKYKTKFGMLILMNINNIICAAKASIPPDSIKDAKGMICEKLIQKSMTLRAASTPQELYDALPKPHPLGQDKFIHAIEGTVGAYSFDYKTYFALPEFDWFHMYNLTEVREEHKKQYPDTVIPYAPS